MKNPQPPPPTTPEAFIGITSYSFVYKKRCLCSLIGNIGKNTYKKFVTYTFNIFIFIYSYFGTIYLSIDLAVLLLSIHIFLSVHQVIYLIK